MMLERPMTISRPISVPPAFTCVDEVLAGLAGLENALVACDDRRGVFVTAYLIITQTIQQCMERRLFLQNEIIAKYVVAFANVFRQALARYEAGERTAVPKAWRQSFDASCGKTPSVIQALLLGINAHINHDLPHAVLRAGINVDCDRCYQDHLRINHALRLAIPLVRQRTATTYRCSLHMMNWLCGNAVDKAVMLSFERARENAWTWAIALDSATRVGKPADVADLINDRAELAGKVILRHGCSLAKCLAVLYRVEHFIPCPTRFRAGVDGCCGGTHCNVCMSADLSLRRELNRQSPI